ncbi:MAG TPA: outer membrane lipoprotein LolB [Noviherbaspirillum sp.]
MTARILRHAAASAALLLLLAGCASVGPFGSASAPVPSTPLEFHRAIDLTGRLSVRYQAGDKEEALHGSFTWSQSGPNTNVTLLSPLGQAIAIIRTTSDGATLEQGGQPPRSAPDVNTLTAETLGWPLPVAGLREWLQGFVIDRDGHRFTASSQTDGVQTRDGWQISYPAWTAEDTMPPQNRPRRIDLSRQTAEAGDVSIRIVIDSWQAR